MEEYGSLTKSFFSNEDDSTPRQQVRLFGLEQKTSGIASKRKLSGETQPFPSRKASWEFQKTSLRGSNFSQAEKHSTLSINSAIQAPTKKFASVTTAQPYSSLKKQAFSSSSFISAGQMKNGVTLRAPKLSYSPQVKTNGIVDRYASFDEFANDDDGIESYDENASDPLSFDQDANDNGNTFNNEVEPISISSCVIPGLQSHSSDADNVGESANSDLKIPPLFQTMFPYPSFNKMQKIVMKELLKSDKHVVICAPTGAGKTVMLEFAIVRALQSIRPDCLKPVILYLSPLKSLCAERVADWKMKFSKIGFVVNELTGDSDTVDTAESEILNTSHLICSTPEKWDWVTRRWREHISNVQLILVDEVHSIGAENRGPTLEAVITRMKMLKSSNVRCVAISATAPNIADIGQWLSNSRKRTQTTPSSTFTDKPNSAQVFHFDETYRPVPLEKVVIGYSSTDKHNAFSFDSMLNYKLPNVIETYSSGKPTLVFCMSRKSAESSASNVAQNLKRTANHSVSFLEKTRQLVDQKLRPLVLQGVGYHHAGLAQTDRQLIEQFFISGQLFVLFSTSTLAVGVNLPAHLVIVKSTWHCTGPMGSTEELSDSDLLQMIGRAGRPQFDTNGRAVVMTRQSTKHRYESLLAGTTMIESYLHRRLVEHMNAEMVMGTIGTVSLALEWIKETFLYVRLSKNPTFYQFTNEESLQKKQMPVDEFLTTLILSALEELDTIGLVSVLRTNSPNDDPKLKPTPYGRLMARHCIAVYTMKLIMQVNEIPDDSLVCLIGLVATCAELEDVALRWNERAALNALNKKCKYPVEGGVKTKSAKISVLIQATLGCMPIDHAALIQDCHRIFRVALRIATCLLETTWLRADAAQVAFGILQNVCVFSKIIRAQLWHDSEHVAKQLPGVGATMSAALVRNKIVTFEQLANANANRLDAICGRHAPFGTNLRITVSGVSCYQVSLSQIEPMSDSNAQIAVSVKLVNASDIARNSLLGIQHKFVILIGDSRNIALGHYRLSDKDLIESTNNSWQNTVVISQTLANEPKSNLSRPSNIKVFVRVVSLELVGCDVTAEFEPKFQPPNKTKTVRFAALPINLEPSNQSPLPQNTMESSIPTNADASTQQHFAKLKMFSDRIRSAKMLPEMAREKQGDEGLGDFDNSFASPNSSCLYFPNAVVVGKPDSPITSIVAPGKASNRSKKAANNQRQAKIDSYLVPRDQSSTFSDESNQGQSDDDLPELVDIVIPDEKPVLVRNAVQANVTEKTRNQTMESVYFCNDDSLPPTDQTFGQNDLVKRFCFKPRVSLPPPPRNVLTTSAEKPCDLPLSNVSKNAKKKTQCAVTLPIEKSDAEREKPSTSFQKPAPVFVVKEKPKQVELFDVFNLSLF